MRVLVTDGNERSALAVCRALVARGHDVHAVAASPFSLAGVSWRVRPYVVTADPSTEPRAYARAVGAHAHVASAEVLVPVTDGSIEALLSHRDLLPPQLAVP